MKAILTYHSLDPSGSAVSLDPPAFRRHVEWLAASGPSVMSVRDLVAAPRDSEAVALTFDDAFASFMQVALPLLLEHGLAATVFVVTGRVGDTNDWTGHGERGIPTLPLMTWEEIGAAQEAGIELGAHTRSHPRLTALADGAVFEELSGSAEDLERHVGVRPRILCYPYGDVDDRVAAATADVFELGCTTDFDVLTDHHRLRLPRLDMVYYRDPRRLEAWGSRAFLRRVRLRSVARRVRSTLGRRAGTRSEA